MTHRKPRTAKALVMQRQYRSRVERNAKAYKRKAKHKACGLTNHTQR